MEKQVIEQSNFRAMSNAQLINYHLQHYQESEALSVYVQRINKDSKTVWLEPENSLQELDRIMQSLQKKQK